MHYSNKYRLYRYLPDQGKYMQIYNMQIYSHTQWLTEKSWSQVKIKTTGTLYATYKMLEIASFFFFFLI